MTALGAYQDSGFIESLFGYFALIPAGFLLALFVGLVAFGIFNLFNLIRRM